MDGKKSRLMQARGLKLPGPILIDAGASSRLMQARGLKPAHLPDRPPKIPSRLMQARGLKPLTIIIVIINCCRASCRRVD